MKYEVQQGEQIQTRVSAKMLKPYFFDLQTNPLNFITYCCQLAIVDSFPRRSA